MVKLRMRPPESLLLSPDLAIMPNFLAAVADPEVVSSLGVSFALH